MENLTALHVKFCMKAEIGWVWTGRSTSSKDTCSEIWGDGADAEDENIDAAISKFKKNQAHNM